MVSNTSSNNSFFSFSFFQVIKMSIIATTVITTIGLTALYVNQNKLIYPSWVNNSTKIVDKPTEFQYPELLPFFKEEYITTSDNIKLQLYSFNKPDYTSKKTLLIFRPNAGNIGHSLPRINYMFHKHDFNVVIWSYRGYGFSEGSPSEIGIKKDSVAVYDFLLKNKYITEENTENNINNESDNVNNFDITGNNVNSNNNKEKKLILLGTSIGGAVAVDFAHEYPSHISSMILENTFLSLSKVIPYVLPWFKYMVPMCHEKWASEKIIGDLNPDMSLLILNSMKDEVVPPNHSVKLYELSNSKNKIIRRFKNGYHNDIMFQKGYWEVLEEFIDQNI